MSIENYYLQQANGMPAFAGPSTQQGYGLGGIFKSLFRSVVPLFRKATPVLKSAAKTVAKEAARTGVDVMEDVLDGKRFGSALQKRSNEAVERTVRKGTKRLRKMMSSPAPGTRKLKRGRISRHRDIFS